MSPGSFDGRTFSLALAAGGVLLLLAALVAPFAARAADPQEGGRLYRIHCAGCHGPDGRPAMPGAPDFSRGERLLRSDVDLARSIQLGVGVMPAYAGRLSEEQILDLVAYLRTLW